MHHWQSTMGHEINDASRRPGERAEIGSCLKCGPHQNNEKMNSSVLEMRFHSACSHSKTSLTLIKNHLLLPTFKIWNLWTRTGILKFLRLDKIRTKSLVWDWSVLPFSLKTPFKYVPFKVLFVLPASPTVCFFWVKLVFCERLWLYCCFIHWCASILDLFGVVLGSRVLFKV